ncbi:MAG: hypothetical protein ABI599_18375 [Flavobacteriales bacterium]
MSTTGISSHRPLPYDEIRREWEAMIARIASVCPIYYSNSGYRSDEGAEVSIDIQYRKQVSAIDAILFSNVRFGPKCRYTTEHLITFTGRQRLRGRRQLGPWNVEAVTHDLRAPGVPPDSAAVRYRYEAGLN